MKRGNSAYNFQDIRKKGAPLLANRKTTILALTSLIAGVLLVIYLFKRNELKSSQRAQGDDGEVTDPVADEPSETGTFKRLDTADGNALVIEDANGKEQSFVCYDNCSPLDENTESYVGKRLRVFWLATADEQDSPSEGEPDSIPTQAPQERIAVRIELLSQ